MLGLPAGLAILYVPVMLQWRGMIRHFVTPLNPSGEAAKSQLQMFEDTRKNLEYVSDLFGSMVGGRLVRAGSLARHTVQVLAIAGHGAPCAHPWRLLLATLAWIALGTAMSIFFYEAMKLPYDSRRNIFQFPALPCSSALVSCCPGTLPRVSGALRHGERSGLCCPSCAWRN